MVRKGIKLKSSLKNSFVKCQRTPFVSSNGGRDQVMEINFHKWLSGGAEEIQIKTQFGSVWQNHI